MEGGMSGMWEGELGGQKEMEKGWASVATPSMVPAWSSLTRPTSVLVRHRKVVDVTM